MDSDKEYLSHPNFDMKMNPSVGGALSQQKTPEGQASLEAATGEDFEDHVDWTLHRVAATIFLAMYQTGMQLPLYFVAGLLSYIAADLKSSVAIGWLPVCNTLAITAFCPFVGSLEDIFGKRYIALFGSLLLCVGHVVLGTSKEFSIAMLGMTLCGTAGAIGQLTGIAGLAETVPVKHRGYSMAGLTAFFIPLSPYILYCQLLATTTTWRWGIWISLIFNGVAALGMLFTYFPRRLHDTTATLRWQTVKQLDFLGAALSISGVTLLLVALQAGGYTHPWSSAYILCMLIIGFALLVTWIVWEAKFAPHPMIPAALFEARRVEIIAFLVAFIAGMNLISLLNFWPLTISNVYNPDPIQIGLRGLPFTLGTIVGAISFNSLLSLWKGGAKWILVIATVWLTTFVASLAVMTPDNVVTTIALGTVASIGLGAVDVPAATVAMIAVPDSLITTCAALTLSVRAIGGSIGYSIFFNIFAQKLKTRLPEYIAERTIEAGLSTSQATTFIQTFLVDSKAAASLPGVTTEIMLAAVKGYQWAYADSLHYVWYATIPMGVLAIIAATCLPDISKYQTGRLAVAL